MKTLFQHAWSEANHDLGYKPGSAPLNSDEKRLLAYTGASSHSGRRTLFTNLARHCAQAGASLRDVQRIAGHADLGTTERYVEPSLEAQRRLIALT